MRSATFKPARSPAVALAIAALIAWSGPSLAQSDHPDRAASAEEPDVPNVPDRHGCMKWCDLDTDPCDPPLYKKADGRCNLQN